ncbi:outer membrane beta-barrel protein [uncultured Pontibacter sp.]|uniref:outer membrane beta-barrel protein n=1 Tax=uncultured Pontibacter sp. TaxID=453356 RepID=UPI0026359E91|nr:outer membrane beta-barrel protein [uncultured Pontibacter sp.]
MKKLLGAAALALLCTGAFAQTSQGTVEIAGSFGFKSISRDYGTDQKSNRFNLGPSVGYFVKDNVAVGMGMSYTREVSKSTEVHYGGYYSGPYTVDVESTNNGYHVSPFITRYFSLTEKVFFTGTGSVGFGKTKSTSEYKGDIQSRESTNSTFRAGVSPGISFFPTSKFGLSASFGFLGYAQYKTEFKNDQNDDYEHSEFGLDLNSSYLNFGLSYFISR